MEIPNGNGTFLATRGELPGLTAYGTDEEEALLLVELAIRLAHAAVRRSPG